MFKQIWVSFYELGKEIMTIYLQQYQHNGRRTYVRSSTTEIH
jgi:hypothetical protein